MKSAVENVWIIGEITNYSEKNQIFNKIKQDYWKLFD